MNTLRVLNNVVYTLPYEWVGPGCENLTNAFKESIKWIH